MLGASPIHGVGMFAAAPIEEGEVVGRVGGELLDEGEFRRRTGELKGYNAIQVAEGLHLLGQLEEVDTAKMNHSCDSNLWLDDEITLTMRRPIAAGQEVTVDYALFTTSEDWELGAECNCRTAACRRSVTGRDWRLADVRARYAGHFSPFLNHRIASLNTGA